MRLQEAAEVIGDDAGATNRAIETARANAGAADIPQRDAMNPELLGALRIGQGWVKAKQRAKDWPEAVLRLGVILLPGKRNCARQAAQDQ